MNVLLAALLLGWAYTTADPVDPARIGLATLEGRYMVELGAGCEDVTAGVNVEVVWASEDMLMVPSASGGCVMFLGERMSDVPCFQTDGVCDVAAEVD
jgi:hypothetical protein